MKIRGNKKEMGIKNDLPPLLKKKVAQMNESQMSGMETADEQVSELKSPVGCHFSLRVVFTNEVSDFDTAPTAERRS